MSFVPPKKNTQYIFYACLVQQVDTKLFQVNPTIAAGDFKVSTDGAAEADLTTLPVVTPAGGRRVKFTLSTAEMNGDNVSVVAHDAAGGEWCDKEWEIQTSVRQIDDLAYPATSGRSMAVTAAGTVGVDWGNVENKTTTNALTGTSISTAQVVASVSGAVGSVAGNIGGNLLGTLTTAERNAIADANLNRDMSAVSDTNARSPLNALRFLRNKKTIAATVLTVTKEDDAATAWTANLVLNSGAVPVTEVDPT